MQKNVGKMSHLLYLEATKVDTQRNSEDERTAGCSNLPDTGRPLRDAVKWVKLVVSNSHL